MFQACYGQGSGPKEKGPYAAKTHYMVESEPIQGDFADLRGSQTFLADLAMTHLSGF